MVLLIKLMRFGYLGIKFFIKRKKCVRFLKDFSIYLLELMVVVDKRFSFLFYIIIYFKGGLFIKLKYVFGCLNLRVYIFIDRIIFLGLIFYFK